MPAADVAALAAAIAFLTRVPVGRVVAVDGRDVARGAPLYPLVGARDRRASAGAVADGASGPLPAAAAAALALGSRRS